MVRNSKIDYNQSHSREAKDSVLVLNFLMCLFPFLCISEGVVCCFVFKSNEHSDLGKGDCWATYSLNISYHLKIN